MSIKKPLNVFAKTAGVVVKLHQGICARIKILIAFFEHLI